MFKAITKTFHEGRYYKKGDVYSGATPSKHFAPVGAPEVKKAPPKKPKKKSVLDD